MSHKLFIRQTPIGSYVWIVFDVRASIMLAQSKEYDTRDEALSAANAFSDIWLSAYDNILDQTPEAKLEAAHGKR